MKKNCLFFILIIISLIFIKPTPVFAGCSITATGCTIPACGTQCTSTTTWTLNGGDAYITVVKSNYGDWFGGGASSKTDTLYAGTSYAYWGNSGPDYLHLVTSACWTDYLTPTVLPCATATPTPTPTASPTPLPAGYYSAGVVTSGQGFFSPDLGSQISGPGWKVLDSTEAINTFGINQTKYDYNYFYQKMGSPTAVNFTGKLKEITDGNTNGVTVFYAGSTTAVDNLQGNWSNYNQNAVIFVNGDLTINTQILVPVGDFLAFIVSGKITVKDTIGTAANSSTSTIEGVYVANGSFNTSDANGAAHLRFVGRGMFVAYGGFNLSRTLGASDTTYAAEYFQYRPDFLINFPSTLGGRRTTWAEIAP